MRPTKPRLSTDKEAKTRYATPLPAEKIEQMPFVYHGGRIIAPWPTHNAMTPEDQQRLLAVLDYVNSAQPDGACWIWPERREPVPVEAPDLRLWLQRWSEGRACYVTRRRL